MCGLVGIASSKPLTPSFNKMFGQLLIIDTLRGPHSTGVFGVDGVDESVTVVKRDVEGYTFVNSVHFDNATSNKNTTILAGHNRYATQGKINTDNAHPFTWGDITLMHNGTLNRFRGLAEGVVFDTDSETIAYAMSQVAPGDVGKVINQLDGAFALVWYDARDKSLNFCRNKERDLYIGTDSPGDQENSEAIVWASEQHMINLVTDPVRNNSPYRVKEVFLTHPMRHYKVFTNKPHLTWGKVKDYKGYVAPVTCTTTYQNNINRIHDNVVGFKVGDLLFTDSDDWRDSTYSCKSGYQESPDKVVTELSIYFQSNRGGNKDTVNTGLQESAGIVKVSSIYQVNGIYKVTCVLPSQHDIIEYELLLEEQEESVNKEIPGKDSRPVTEQVYLESVKHGCAMCSCDLGVQDADDISWVGDSPLCLNCKDYDMYANLGPSIVDQAV